MLTHRHCRSMLNYDFVIAGRLFLTILLVMLALSVVRMDEVIEDQGPSYDVEGFNGLNEATVVILDKVGQKHPRADKRWKPSDHRHELKNIAKENGPVAKDDDKEDDENFRIAEQLHKDYVEVARSTNDIAHAIRASATSPKRRPTMNIVVDVLAVVDNKLYNRFLNRHRKKIDDAVEAIKKYYSYVFTEIDTRYLRINDSELSIRVRLVDIFIAQTRSDSPWSAYNVEYVDNVWALHPYDGLHEFKKWLKTNQGTLPKCDHAMAFTGYVLGISDVETIPGIAIRQSYCKIATGQACSLIMEYGGLSSANTATHELGHALGAVHDGETSDTSCSANLSYIMAPIRTQDREFFLNSFRFSPCTIRRFKFLLSFTNIECLLDSVADKITVLPGQVFSPDDQCKGFYGPNSRLCDILGWPPQENFCALLWCKDPNPSDKCVTHSNLIPVIGTPCGTEKVCKYGECLNKTEVLESLERLGVSAKHTQRASSLQNQAVDSLHLLRSQSKRSPVDRNATRTQG